MKKPQFEVGEQYICTCGASVCLPFTVIEFDSYLMGVDINGSSAVYTQEDYAKIRPVTKLEKAMK